MKSVFVFSNQSLFGQGIRTLLCEEPELEVLGWETDLDEAIRRIKRIHPQVVILAGEDAATDSSPAVTRILEECRGIVVVEANLGCRMLRIYGEGQGLAREIQELMDVIEDATAAGEPALQSLGPAALGPQAKVSKSGERGV